MNLFDIIVLAIVISSTLMGLYKGLIRLSISLISFCLSLTGAYFMLPIVETAVSEHIQNTIAVNITSGVIAYLISMLFFAFLGGQVTKMADGISGGLIDRLLGLVVGALRGLVICSGLFALIAVFASDAYVGAKMAKDVADKIDHDKYPKWLTGAATYDTIENSAKIFGGLISDKSLRAIKLPIPPKHLPAIPTEMLDKAANAATQHVIEHVMQQQEVQHKESEGSGVAPKPSDEHDALDSQLKEILGQ